VAVTDLESQIRAIAREEARAALAEVDRAAGGAPTGYITIAEYARRRSISPNTVRAAIRAERLPALRFGRAVRVPADVEIGRPVRAAAENDNRAAAAAARADRRLGGR
jgi:excisionase family DNA binding protein